MISVYRTVNNKNGKVYIGVHRFKNSRSYIGCGVYSKGCAERQIKRGVKSPFIRAVLKYGYESFTCKEIKIFNNYEEAYAYERLIVGRDFINSKNTYNVKLGGDGGECITQCIPTKIVNKYTKEVKEFISRREVAEFLDITNFNTNVTKPKGEWLFYGNKNPLLKSVEMFNYITLERRTFRTIYEASEEIGTSMERLLTVVNNTGTGRDKRGTVNGWCHSEEHPKYRNHKRLKDWLDGDRKQSFRKFCKENGLPRMSLDRLKKKYKYE